MQDQSKNAQSSTAQSSTAQSSSTPQKSSTAQTAQSTQTAQAAATGGGTGGTTQGGGHGGGGGGGGYGGGGGGGGGYGNDGGFPVDPRPKADPILTQRLVALEDAIQGSTAVQLKRPLNWSGLNENTVALDSIAAALENSIPPNRPTSDLPPKKSGGKATGG